MFSALVNADYLEYNVKIIKNKLLVIQEQNNCKLLPLSLLFGGIIIIVSNTLVNETTEGSE